MGVPEKLSPKLEVLAGLARQAGEILRSGFRGEHSISHKSDSIDLITEMDHRSEAYLLRELRRRFPGHRIVTEESGELDGDGDGSDDRSWYIDPLDGTVNYAHGIPIYSVSIAYAENGRVRMAAVYDPSQDECFTAERGAGAFVNGERVRVSEAGDLSAALLVTGFPYDMWTNPVNNLDHFGRLSMRTQGVRRLGSAALDLCYVAAGRFDGFWELRLKAWDIAAGGLIVEEAGGWVTTMEGSPDYLQLVTSILAANPALHGRMLEELKVTNSS
jgi:myo-inositol-1(or 4)-monophosphatase